MRKSTETISASAIGIFRALPGRWREHLKILMNSAGHAPGWVQYLRAKRLATGAKRLDLISTQLAEMMAWGGIERLSGAHCLEFGSGHLLSEALVYHLAGAREVVAVDYFPILQPAEVSVACRGVDPEKIVATLGRYDTPDNVQARLMGLLRRRDWSLEGLAELGISYIAPFDAARGPLDRAFDVITSTSVLEHVPVSAANPIFSNLFAMLRPDGTMIHRIHVEDHRDFHREPFAFLAANTDWTEADCDRRGNRLRPSDWQRIADELELAFVTMKVLPGDPSKLPSAIDPSLSAYDVKDLSAAGVILGVRRQTVNS
ncbi:methyltransferase domain-containing protein [Microvirga alba]|uniref:Methyltransferase domain-containing protein n=1 Tax=Microvirga alba TaxID=2791025 RepID=A0A931BUP3_9HYPH|nr:methyltransferase domain-containing protein [Microvirga alba]MBF9234145.1 methyltransferase domain-containing protein [Microvirga alba]